MNIRYVITHLDRNGMRTLADPAQGRFTYASAADAQARLDDIMRSNNIDKLRSIFGFPLEVRAVECYERHNDPRGVWFD